MNHSKTNHCPFCNKENQCMAYSKNPCWCTKVEIPNQLIALISSELQKKVCICSHCIDLYNKNPDHFKSHYSQN